jgi:FkbM family methyltransferase
MNIKQLFYGEFILGKDYLSQEIQKKGEDFFWDSFLRPVFDSELNNSSVILEVGANIGLHTVYLSKICKQVIAFEPQREIYYQLCGNLFVNQCFNVKAYNNCIYDKSCMMSILDTIDYTINNNAPMLGFFESEQGNVKAITIDSLNMKPDFIKIDAQGSDLQCLYGAEQTILKHKPTILFEIENKLKNVNCFQEDDYFKFLNKINYNVRKISKGSDYIATPK